MPLAWKSIATYVYGSVSKYLEEGNFELGVGNPMAPHSLYVTLYSSGKRKQVLTAFMPSVVLIFRKSEVVHPMKSSKQWNCESGYIDFDFENQD